MASDWNGNTIIESSFNQTPFAKTEPYQMALDVFSAISMPAIVQCVFPGVRVVII